MTAISGNMVRAIPGPHQTLGPYRVAMSLGLYPVGAISPRQEPLTRIMTGLPFLQKDEHRKHRRLMMPAFHKQAVHAYHNDMVTATLEMLDRWKAGQKS